jgi:hypothetical protein
MKIFLALLITTSISGCTCLVHTAIDGDPQGEYCGYFFQKCDALYSSGGHPLIADDEIAGDVI